jgi:hypothetical protein
MVVRRRKRWEVELAPDVKIRCRYDIEQDIVAFANVLVASVDGEWRTVELFDCTHGDRNDHHRYDSDGYKYPAVVFHHGTPAEAYRTSMLLITPEFRRMIERWQA